MKEFGIQGPVYFPWVQSTAELNLQPPLYLSPQSCGGVQRGVGYTTRPWLTTDQQRQQPQLQPQHQQQWGPSPRAMHALDLYRACLAAGQNARFLVEQRPEGEYFSLTSRPPPQLQLQQPQQLEKGGLAGSRTRNGLKNSVPGGRAGAAPQQPGPINSTLGKAQLAHCSSSSITSSRGQPAAAARSSTQ